MNGVKDVWANVIWKGEEFNVEYNERGQLAFKSHSANWMAATGKKEDILGAYCIIEREDGVQFLTVMTMAEIQTSWSQSSMQTVQNKYPQEMAKRTVINRASKAFINTSDDSDLFIGAINRTTENEFEDDKPLREINPQHEIDKNANKEVLDFVEPTTGEIIEHSKEAPKEPEPITVTSDGPGF